MNADKNTELPKDVADLLENVENQRRRADSEVVIEIMRRVTSHEPCMWGETLIGFDTYHYKYESGREGDSFITGLSPQKTETGYLYYAGIQVLPEFIE